MRRPQSQPRSHNPTVNSFGNSPVGYDYSADLSYPQSSGYHSIEVNDGETEEFEFDQTNKLTFRTNSETETHLAYDENSAGTWTERPSDIQEDVVVRSYRSQSWENQLSDSGYTDVQPGSLTVKRIGKAVLDFRSALRGALRKVEGPVGTNSGDLLDFESAMPSDLPTSELSLKLSSTQGHIEKNLFHENDVGSARTFGDLSKNNSIEKSNDDSVKPVVDKISKSLESLDSGQNPPHLSKISSSFEETSMGPDSLVNTTPTPDGLTKLTGESISEKTLKGPEDVNEKEQVSQCTTEESLSASFQADEHVALQKVFSTEKPQKHVTDITGGLEVQPVGDEAASSTETPQIDERKLKCLRSFQQILREKRETRRNLVSMTMSTFSQEEMEQGSNYFTF